MGLLREHCRNEGLSESFSGIMVTSCYIRRERGIVISEVLLMLSDLSLVLLDLLKEQELLWCPWLSRVLLLR